MELKKYLFQRKDKIECTACGKCCPSICPHKEGKLCRIHPKKLERKGVDDREQVCRSTPIELLVFGAIACPPVIDEIENKTGIRLGQDTVSLSVPHVNSQQLNKVLKMKVK